MNKILIHEVGLRDGLQMEKQVVPLEQKIIWAEKLIAFGIDILQLGSFVHPQKVPQMADTDSLFMHFKKPENKPKNTFLSALILNEKGFERGEACGVEMYNMGVSASETHSMKNTGMSSSDAAERIIAIAKTIIASGKRVQVSVQSAFGCGFEGKIPEEKVITLVQKYIDAGIKNISLADTSGHAIPDQVSRLFEVLTKLNSSIEWGCHFHNTYGMGIANCYAALKTGVKYFESSIAGLGGCPFTKVAAGNVCTEDFLHSLQRAGQRKDIEILKLIELAKDFSQYFNRDLPGLVYKCGALNY
jgi:hydroxymethylglutaryl-CoA lyase